jgi:hypothetical protein
MSVQLGIAVCVESICKIAAIVIYYLRGTDPSFF